MKIEATFELEMDKLYERTSHTKFYDRITEREKSYIPTGWKTLVNEYIEAKIEFPWLTSVRRLLADNSPASGYNKLWDLQRIDLSVEYFVLMNPKFYPLFNKEEIATCGRRIVDLYVDRFNPTNWCGTK